MREDLKLDKTLSRHPLLGKQQNVVIVTKPTIQVTRAATSKTTHCIVVHTTQSKNSEPK